MQLAINALIFIVGFALATFASLRTRAAKGQQQHLRRVFDDLRSLLARLSPAAAQSSPIDEEILSPESAKAGADLLFTREQVISHFAPETWQRAAHDALAERITRRGPRDTFPCVYATKGLRDGEHRYLFLPSDDLSEPRNVRLVARALAAYLTASRSIGPNTSLVILCAGAEAGSERSLDWYNDGFWTLLRGLRLVDPKPWPADIPTHTDSARWTFCFDGVPLFPVALTPLHEKRRSRWAPNFVIALQPKWVLDLLLGTPEKRLQATKKVRTLLEKYDDVPVSPDLTAYGEEGTSEKNQLFLLDDNENPHGECPFGDIEG